MLHANSRSTESQGQGAGNWSRPPSKPCRKFGSNVTQAAGIDFTQTRDSRDEGRFCINKILRGEKKIKFYFLLEKKKTSSIVDFLVQWSCQTTSQLSPGLTSPLEFSDPLGEASGGALHSWGISNVNAQPAICPLGLSSGSLRVS